VNINTVKLCLSKYEDGGMQRALFDDQRTGRCIEITDDAVAWIIDIACQRPSDLGYAQELWTLKNLHKHIREHAQGAGFPRLLTITKPMVQKILKRSDIKPFKIKYYCEKRDPDFGAKMHGVLIVYEQAAMQFDEMYPEEDIIRIICDNHSAHKSREVQNYLSTRPEGRFVFVFALTHGSWLSLIESFFSKMTKQMPKGIRVKSKEELAESIHLYFDEVNADPVVYHWTYKLDEISVEEVKKNVGI